ncbi:MAG: hypothetical protein ACP6IP_07835, partial [Candidatus Njordarchaeia archaeon]
GDGKLEVVVGSDDGKVYCFGFSGFTAPWDVVWQGHHGTFLGDNNFLNCDCDIDGLSNSWEILHGLDLSNADCDGDGLPDGWEVSYGLDPLDSSDASLDKDGDGLTNLQEFQLGTNPNDRWDPLFSPFSESIFASVAVVVFVFVVLFLIRRRRFLREVNLLAERPYKF